MSTNSILTYNQESLKQKYSDKLDCLANRFMAQRNFRIGEEVEESEVEHTLLMSRMLCTERCEIINYVADIISGKLENCGVKPKDKKLKTLKGCCDKTANACDFDKCTPRIEF